MKRFGIGLVFATAVVGLIATPAAQAAKYTMKIGHALPPGDPRDLGARKVAEVLAKDPRCDVKATVYPSGQLGGTTDVIEAAQIGSVEMAIMPASFLVGFQPLMGIFDFPFFWPSDVDQLLKIHKGSAMQKLLATTDEKGIKSIAVWHTGYKQWTANKPLVAAGAFEGLTARVMPSKVLAKQDRLLGMTPVTMPFAETYSALQNKAIDAQENPITTSYMMKFHEVQRYMTITSHGTLDQVIMLSKTWWDSLPPSCQAAVRNAVEEGGKVCVEATYRLVDKALDAFSKSGMQVVNVPKADIEAMQQKVLPGIEKFYVEQNGERGREILQAFKKELGM